MSVTPATELFANPWVRITLEQAGRVVRVQRTAERLTDEGMVALAQAASTHMPRLRRAHWCLLLDARYSPLLADEEAARKVKEGTQHLFEGFVRHAILVTTAVGRLQANRITRDQARSSYVFDDEGEALAYLRGGSQPPGR